MPAGDEERRNVDTPGMRAFVMYELNKLRIKLRESLKSLKIALNKADETWSKELASIRSIPTKQQSQVWTEFERLKAVGVDSLAAEPNTIVEDIPWPPKPKMQAK